MASIKISEDTFGTIQSLDKIPTDVKRYTLTTENGISVQIIDYGATITSIKVPDRNGELADIVLGFDDITGYLGKDNPYFGATVGRVANRTGKGRFTIDGNEYQLPINNGPNSLHGGDIGFDKLVWQSKARLEENKVVFSLSSPDGDQGYPGDLIAQVTYQLTSDNQLKFDFQAVTTKPTPVNLTNHSYFNLAGHAAADKKLEDHFIQLNADKITPVDDNLLPTGNIEPVKGTVFDFRTQKNLGKLLSEFPPGPNGYDNNFCLNLNEISNTSPLRPAARAQHKPSGRVLEVHTDQPGVQFYTANFFPVEEDKESPILGKGGAKYFKHGGFCLETQNYPNAVNQKNFPNAVLQPGEVYRHAVLYKFYTVE